METVRLRLVFDHIPSKSQNADALKRCWVLLKPQHKTISDLSSYLLHVFNLQDECPSGLLLSMEGFALPHFESTSILKDKDIIRVEKNGCVPSEIVMVDDEPRSLEMVEIVETPPVAAGMNLLANEEFEKESGGYLSEEEEDAQEQAEDAVQLECASEEKKVSKKRKASKVLKSSKRKKNKSASSEKSANALEDIGNNVNGEQNATLATTEVSAERLCQAQENCSWHVYASPTLGEAEKLRSRSSRRKASKRQLRKKWKAERKKLLGKSDQLSSEENDTSLSRKSAQKRNQEVSEDVPERDGGKVPVNQQPHQDNDVEEDLVPVVIRPGHIRFQPLEEASPDQTVKQNQTHWMKYMELGKKCSTEMTSLHSCEVQFEENFQWNGITNKKKGQKWGKEKATSHKRKDYKIVNQEQSEVLNNGVGSVSHRIDFEKLEFYTSLPKEGDVIAYRLIELSSSWTPEPSSYRVGKIKQYDIGCNRVQLLQVPGYPIFPDKEMDSDATALPSETSPYAGDGSLWIEFSSLVEVRLVRQGKSNSAKSIASGVDEVWVGDQDTGTDAILDNGNETHASAQENGNVNPWEEINQALSAKKEQLSQEDNWSRAESSGRKPWSYKALRGGALGPTMALLRAQNEI